MSEFPYMSWWVADYFADTSHLTCEQHGVYIMLLGIAWQQPGGPALPNDMAWLKRALQAKCSDMHGNRFNRIVPDLLRQFFHLMPDDHWQQFRQFSEWEKSRKRSTNARENAGKRWVQTKNIKDLERALAMPRQSHRNANHTYKERILNSSSKSTGTNRNHLAPTADLPTDAQPADLALPPEDHSPTPPPRQNGHASPTLAALVKAKGWTP